MNIVLTQACDGATANIKEDRQCTCDEKQWRVRVRIVSGKAAMISMCMSL